MRANAFAAGLEKLFFGRIEEWFFLCAELWVVDAEHVLVRKRGRIAVIDKVPLLGHTKIFHSHFEFVRAEEPFHFSARPAIELAFLAFAVGVLGGIKSALGAGHVAENADSEGKEIGRAH